MNNESLLTIQAIMITYDHYILLSITAFAPHKQSQLVSNTLRTCSFKKNCRQHMPFGDQYQWLIAIADSINASIGAMTAYSRHVQRLQSPPRTPLSSLLSPWISFRTIIAMVIILYMTSTSTSIEKPCVIIHISSTSHPHLIHISSTSSVSFGWSSHVITE